MTLELDAVLGNAPESLEGEDLEAPGIGEHGAIPCRESVESAHRPDSLFAGAKVEVIRIAKNHLSAGSTHVTRA